MLELSTQDTLKMKKTRIITAAMQVFAKKGYDKGSVSDVASKAKIGKATMYYYFDNKEELFMEAVKLAYQLFFEAIESKVATLTGFEERFKAMVRLPIRYIFDHVPILAEAQKNFPAALINELEELRIAGRQRMRDNLHSLFRQGIAEGVIDDRFSFEATSNVIHDWMMMAELGLGLQEKEMIMRKLERDQDVLIDMILYGIIKRS